MIFYTLPWSRWNRTHKYVRCTVRDSRIRSEMSWSSIHTKIWTTKQLHHCTQRWIMKIFNVMLRNRIKIAVSKWPCSTFSNAMLNRSQLKISLVPKHQLIIPSTLFALATNIRRYKATNIHTLTPLTYKIAQQRKLSRHSMTSKTHGPDRRNDKSENQECTCKMDKSQWTGECWTSLRVARFV